jgi:hypothetical protein
MEANAEHGMSWLSRMLWKLAEVGVILAAGVLMLHSRSPFLCAEIGAFLLGVLIISVATRLIGNPVRKRVIWLALVTILAGSAIGYVHYKASANCLFRDFVVDPMPNSVRILDSQSVFARDYAIFLHFQLAPGDFDALLRKRQYKAGSDQPGQGGPGLSHPPWWQPQLLANPALHLWEGGTTETAWLWVNEARTEAYFAYESR